MNRATGILKALVALSVLAALMGGVPWVLLDWLGHPLSGLGGAEGEDLITSLLSDDGLMAVMGLAVWAAWALLVISVVTEVVAQARGLDRSRLNVGGPLQKLAGFLVGSIMFGLMATPASASPGELPPLPTAAAELTEGSTGYGNTGYGDGSSSEGDYDVGGYDGSFDTYPDDGGPMADDADFATVADADDDVAGADGLDNDGETITVGRSDTAWSLAEEYLGDGARYHEIWELNQDVVQADGSEWTDASDPVQPGWRLTLPSGAETGEPEVASGDTAAEGSGSDVDDEPAPTLGVGEVVVQPGDHFWSLAKERLTEAWGRAPSDAEIVPYWEELISHNEDRLLPPEDPDLIYPEQVFVTPVPGGGGAGTTDDGSGSGGAGSGDTGTGSSSGSDSDPGETGDVDRDRDDGAGSDVDGSPDDDDADVDDADVDDADVDDADVDDADVEDPDENVDDADVEDPDENVDDDDETAEGAGTGRAPTVEEMDERLDEAIAIAEVEPELLERLPEDMAELIYNDLNGDPPLDDALTGDEEAALGELGSLLRTEYDDLEEFLLAEVVDDEAAGEEQADGEQADDRSGSDRAEGTGAEGRDTDEPADTTRGGDVAAPPRAEDMEARGPQAPPDSERGASEDPDETDSDSTGVDDSDRDEQRTQDGATVDDQVAEDDGGLGVVPGGPGGAGEPGGSGEPGDTDDTDDTGGGDVAAPPLDVEDPVANGPVTSEPAEFDDDTTSSVSDDDTESGSLAPIGLVGGGIALAGVLLLLDRRRRAQQRHRRRGQLIDMPDEDLEQRERELRHGADVDTAQLLDVALRAAAAGSGATGLPSLRWVETTGDDRVLLMLDGPSPAPPGFRNVSADRWESTGSAADLDTIGASASPPVPTLIPVAATGEGNEVLVDLESSGVVVVDGDPSDVEGLLRATAAAVATVPWSEQTRVLLVGMGGQLTDLPWVESVDTLEEAVAEAEDYAAKTVRALRSVDCPTTAQARAAGVLPDQWDPLIVLSAIEPEDDDLVDRLAGLAEQAHSAVGLVVPSMTGDVPGRRLTVLEAGELEIEGAEVDAWPRRLEPDDAADLVGLLDTAGRLADVAPDPDGPPNGSIRRPVAADDELAMEEIQFEPLEDLLDDSPLDRLEPAGVGLLEDDWAVEDVEAVGSGAEEVDALESLDAVDSLEELEAAEEESFDDDGAVMPEPAGRRGGELAPNDDLGELLGEVDVLVRVLGEVEAVRLEDTTAGVGPLGRAEPAESRLVPTRQKGLEAVAYLALRESGVGREDLEAALFPEGASAAKTVYNTVSSARTLVGDELFPAADGGRYELSERVLTDYGLFCELVALADETEDAARAADRLTSAMSLVRGEPFVGVGRGYAWVGSHRGMIVAQVIDAADELGEIRLAMGDWRAAEWAARQGLRAFPADERMYRLLMRTARAAGNTPGVHRMFRELCDVIADPDVGVEPEDTLHPESVALYEELTGAASSRR